MDQDDIIKIQWSENVSQIYLNFGVSKVTQKSRVFILKIPKQYDA